MAGGLIFIFYNKTVMIINNKRGDMKQVLNKNAGPIAVITTAIFAILIWWYAVQGTSQTSNFIIFGVILAFIDLSVLFCVINSKPISKKKGKK
jgi:uncharacterized membrane protein YobD (UPF0266 family)